MSKLSQKRVKINVSSEPNKADLFFTVEANVQNNIHIRSVCRNILELQDKYPQLAPIKPSLNYTYEDVEVIAGPDYYHSVLPTEFL